MGDEFMRLLLDRPSSIFGEMIRPISGSYLSNNTTFSLNIMGSQVFKVIMNMCHSKAASK